jgi:ornithine cyclodeaminase/alanine dehydrogenase-like protein (mu-crystallin family)
MLHLDEQAITDLLDPAAVTEAVGAAFAAWGRGEAATTPRLRAASSGQMASAMAAVVPPYSGGKVYSTAGGRFTFVDVLFGSDGQLLCTLDGDVLTRLRTPAASALAIRSLAVPGARSAALIGSGRQAWPHIEMLMQEIPLLERLALWGRRSAAVDDLVRRARALGIPAVAAPGPRAAVDDADVVITVTSGADVLFEATDISERTLVCAVGATKYDRREVGEDTVRRCAAIVCDDVVGSQVECGDLIYAHAVGAFSWTEAVELRDVVAGIVTVPRSGPAPVLFETQGVAIQDIAAAALAYERHVAAGGTAPPTPR